MGHGGRCRKSKGRCWTGMIDVVVIGGGLAGSEASWQLAKRGVSVVLYEMRPARQTPAHKSGFLAELVCSNSLGSNVPDRAPGLLKTELEALGSLILECARETAVPAGGALAVDREAFARLVTERVESHPLIEVRREEVERVAEDRLTIVASGPLTSDSLAPEIARLAGDDQLYFYDALAPIVKEDSLDFSKVFRAARYGRGGDDYINCPMDRDEYVGFVEALISAERIPLRGFEESDKKFFEACLPVEVIASRGEKALAFGPLRPVGLTDPRTGRRPWAVVQLRQDNLAATLYNLVGFQTNLKWGEQERVFRLIPGLEKAEFVRFGQMHRNTFVNSPALLEPTMRLRNHPLVFLAGQIVGMEGYVASTASGMVAGLNAARYLQERDPLTFPATTMIGALCRYVSAEVVTDFQPMKPNFGILPEIEQPLRKRDKREALRHRALSDLAAYVAAQNGDG